MTDNSVQIVHKCQRCFLLTGMTLLTPCDKIVVLMEVSEDGILRKNIFGDYKVETTEEWREFPKDQLLFAEKSE